MDCPTPHDLEITRRVRAVPANHWVNLGKISIRTVSGAVYLRGVLDQSQQPDDNLDSSHVSVMVDEIKGVAGVERFSLHLDNWREAAGQWEPANAS